MEQAQKFVASDYFWNKIDKAYNNIYDNFAGENAYGVDGVPFNGLDDKGYHINNDKTEYQDNLKNK
jgi:hypothetical protein